MSGRRNDTERWPCATHDRAYLPAVVPKGPWGGKNTHTHTSPFAVTTTAFKRSTSRNTGGPAGLSSAFRRCAIFSGRSRPCCITALFLQFTALLQFWLFAVSGTFLAHLGFSDTFAVPRRSCCGVGSQQFLSGRDLPCLDFFGVQLLVLPEPRPHLDSRSCYGRGFPMLPTGLLGTPHQYSSDSKPVSGGSSYCTTDRSGCPHSPSSLVIRTAALEFFPKFAFRQGSYCGVGSQQFLSGRNPLHSISFGVQVLTHPDHRPHPERRSCYGSGFSIRLSGLLGTLLRYSSDFNSTRGGSRFFAIGQYSDIHLIHSLELTEQYNISLTRVHQPFSQLRTIWNKWLAWLQSLLSERRCTIATGAWVHLGTQRWWGQSHRAYTLFNLLASVALDLTQLSPLVCCAPAQVDFSTTPFVIPDSITPEVPIPIVFSYHITLPESSHVTQPPAPQSPSSHRTTGDTDVVVFRKPGPKSGGFERSPFPSHMTFESRHLDTVQNWGEGSHLWSWEMRRANTNSALRPLMRRKHMTMHRQRTPVHLAARQPNA